MPSATLTAAEICNEALLYVGQGQTINSLEEATQEARACKVYYAKARDSLLQSFPWGFATKRAVLALLSGETRTGWAYTYALPVDCLTPLRIWNGERQPAARSKIQFDIESTSSLNGDVSGQCLVTDRETAELIYTAQVSTVPLYPPLFVEALAWGLAQKLALILPIKPQLAVAMEQKAVAAFRRATTADIRASQADVAPPPSEYTSAR